MAEATGALIWDEETREVFTPEEWTSHRLTRWTEEMPALSDHTTIHLYRNGEFMRAITLGMTKFGLPDVVVNDFAWSLQRNVAHTINLLAQSLAEGEQVGNRGRMDLDLRRIRNAAVRDPQLESLIGTGSGRARLVLVEAQPEEGDPDNRLLEIVFDEHDGRDVHARQEKMLATFFGSDDSATRITHNDELRAASEEARKRLPALRSKFNAGLAPGESILLKAPFPTDDGGNEWMWVEVTRWSGDAIRGSLNNEPTRVSRLQAGQLVEISESDVFDYIYYRADGTEEGNTTGKIIEKMNAR